MSFSCSLRGVWGSGAGVAFVPVSRTRSWHATADQETLTANREPRTTDHEPHLTRLAASFTFEPHLTRLAASFTLRDLS